MSKLDELIQNLCPNGVEYKKITDIAETFIGLVTTMTKHYCDEGIKLLHNSDIKENKIVLKSVIYLDREFAKKNESRIHKIGDIITVHTGDIGTSAVIEKEFEGSLGFATIVTRLKKDNPYYVSYFLNSNECKKQIYQKVKGDRNNLNLKDFNEIIVPVPPREVQEEIVRILDNFTELTAELTEELTEELTARRKQYEYYRNVMFESLNGVDTTLGEICKFVRGPFGGALKKEIFVDDGYAVYEQQNAIYSNTDIRYFITEQKFNEMKRFEVKPNDLIMSCSGTVGRIFVIPNDAPKGIINQALLKLTPDDNVDSNFLKYVFDNYLTSIMDESSRGGGLKNVPGVDVLKAVSLKLPSLEKQRKLVNKLNIFKKYCEEIKDGLPAEIELRKQQYEYYRDKLLSFKELK